MENFIFCTMQKVQCPMARICLKHPLRKVGRKIPEIDLFLHL